MEALGSEKICERVLTRSYRRHASSLMALALVLSASSLFAQSYDLRPGYFTNLGGVSQGSGYEVSGLLGYWVAGESTSSLYRVLPGYTVLAEGGPVIIGDGSGPGGRGPGIPRSFALTQNYPNPFNPQTTIQFDIPGNNREAEVNVRLNVYDLRGKRVRELLSRALRPGTYQVHWDGRDDRGERLSSGIYLYRLVAGTHVATRKMMMVK